MDFCFATDPPVSSGAAKWNGGDPDYLSQGVIVRNRGHQGNTTYISLTPAEVKNGLCFHLLIFLWSLALWSHWAYPLQTCTFWSYFPLSPVPCSGSSVLREDGISEGGPSVKSFLGWKWWMCKEVQRRQQNSRGPGRVKMGSLHISWYDSNSEDVVALPHLWR